MTPDPNIVLTGFMGAGKTAVGREVATRLGRSFVDLDDLIAQEAGMSIPDIFARHGEPYFRKTESRLLRKLAAETGLVVATGGGALVDVSNRELVARTSLLFCLDANADEIEQRLKYDATRPLLALPDRRARILELLAQRAPAYAEIPYHIDTSGRSVAEVAEAVTKLATSRPHGVLRLPVALPGAESYDILIGAGLLAWLPELLAERGLTGRVAAVMDEAVAAAWADRLGAHFAACGRSLAQVVLPAGERHKNLATIARIYDELLAADLDRNGIVVAVGGGVIGDMAGFAAATFLRGVHFVQVPTTLLAMVDASVGGKTGVDLPQGKNLVGAFKQPDLVVMDPNFLATLPPDEFRNGLAEVIKHGVIADPDLFAQLEGDGPDSIESLLARAVRVKIGVVQRDPFEKGERAHLNLGHTFGHAFEQVSGYRLPHGQGVAVGLVAAAELAAARGDCSPDTAARIRAVIERLGLPTSVSSYDPQALLVAMATDKKRQSGRLHFVLPHAIGQVAVHDDVAADQIIAALMKVISKPGDL